MFLQSSVHPVCSRQDSSELSKSLSEGGMSHLNSNRYIISVSYFNYMYVGHVKYGNVNSLVIFFFNLAISVFLK